MKKAADSLLNDSSPTVDDLQVEYLSRAATLRDVAARAGVGQATASYVLNNKPKSIGAETRERVWRAARDIGYRPNMAARSLMTRQTHLVALWIPNVATAFAARVIGEIQNQARAHNYEVMICDTQRAERSNADQSDEASVVLQLPQWNVDGIIAFFGSSSRVIERDNTHGALVPTVSMGAHSIKSTDFVSLDLHSASCQALQWLLTQRKRVGFLVPRAADFPGDERREAYVQTLNAHNVEPVFIHMSDNSRAAAFYAMRKYLQAHSSANLPIDALFCYNDYAAIGAGRALREANLHIPDDVLIVGCDDIEDGDYLEWPLHTIALPIPQMCATAWQFFQTRFEQPKRSLQVKNFVGELKIKSI